MGRQLKITGGGESYSGLLDFDETNYIELDSIPDLTGNKRVTCKFVADSSGAVNGLFTFTTTATGDSGIRVWTSTNYIDVYANTYSGGRNWKFDLTPFGDYSGQIIDLEVTKDNAKVLEVKWNGTICASFGTAAAHSTTSYKQIGNADDAYPLNGTIWDVKVYDEPDTTNNLVYHWKGYPAGNTNAAWTGVVGGIDGSVSGGGSLRTEGTGTTTNKLKISGAGTVHDIDGNIYPAVTIGTQTWMGANLRTTKYADGTPIPNITDNTTWANATAGAYCYFDNCTGYKDTYGALYNRRVVLDASGLAPNGWRIATQDDWNTLITYIGGAATAAYHLKESGDTHWLTGNAGVDTYKFSALGSAHRYSTDGTFSTLKQTGYFQDDTSAYYYMVYNSNSIYSSTTTALDQGYPIRCVKETGSINLNNKLLLQGKQPYAPETIALLARMETQPSVALTTLIDDTIKELIAQSIWSNLDFLYFFNVHDASAACLNWIKAAHNITVYGSTSWTEYLGFTGYPTCTDSYLGTNYTPATSAVNYTQDDAVAGLFFIDVSMGGTEYELNGAWDSNYTTGCRWQLNFNNGYVPNQAYAGGGLNGPGHVSSFDNSSGYIGISRSNAASIDIYVDDASENILSTHTPNSEVPDFEILLLALNNASGIDTYHCRDTISCAFTGASLTSAQHVAMKTIINNFNSVASTL